MGIVCAAMVFMGSESVRSVNPRVFGASGRNLARIVVGTTPGGCPVAGLLRREHTQRWRKDVDPKYRNSIYE